MRKFVIFFFAEILLTKDNQLDFRKLKQIENERKIMSITDHPFIVKLHWAFQTNTTLNFCLDLWVGGELFYRLKKEKRFTESRWKFYFVELLIVFEYLHSLGIVYRDLKPENILIDIDGHIKLADFGLSKQIKGFKTNSFWGSPEYMSPEMLKGDPHDCRLDIYWLGALLYEMTTGLPPHYSRNTNDMYLKIIESEVDFPLWLSDEPVDLMKSLLQKDPDNRPQTIEEIKQHKWFENVEWNDYYNKLVEPLWKPSLEQSNFDPEFSNQTQITQKPEKFEGPLRQDSFWIENINSSVIESNFSSRTVTEQSIWQSFISEINASIINMKFDADKFNVQVPFEVADLKNDESINVENTAGYMSLNRFSFSWEPYQELEIKKQIDQYLKLKKNRENRNS